MTTQTGSSSQRVRRQEAGRPSLAAVVIAVPMRFKIVVGLALVVVALMAAGVPLGSLVPFAGLAACLGMHFLMGHGAHGGDHAVGRHDEPADRSPDD